MLNRQMIEPKKMLNILSTLREGFFAIRCQLSRKTYQVLLYKYEKDYFLLKNPYLFHLLMDRNAYYWNDQEILDSIEATFDENQYYPTSKEWVELDLSTLKLKENVEIEWFQFED
ncbi:hypothetical protein NRIC_15600 [Enterococcus florum]|uniref:Uncharacterized protein n=1 Tax=Enterococcus florum TaxID=2480627 RepID=A0A4V0WPF4_9ENTE|nr:hypothetical protein [Enterococcus florum]GCF93669.1 hypothetical protein NRIC_15600 [Enterococcus florum]